MTAAYPGLAIPGATYPGQTTSKVFRPPTVRRPMDTTDPLFRRLKINVGLSVLKTAGFYTTVESPSPEDIAAADIAYLGGRVYPISPDEAAALTAAGYTVEEM